MARNKYPEETINRIIDVASTLFLEKGYDNTTIQDIIDKTGLSKGAIYHHFTSKKEIFGAVAGQKKELGYIMKIAGGQKDGNAHTRIRKVIVGWIKGLEAHENDHSQVPMLELIDNSQFIVAMLNLSLDDIALMFERLFREGNDDGSLNIPHPSETAQVMSLMMNFWINPLLNVGQESVLAGRFIVFKEILKSQGADIVDEEVEAAFWHYYHTVTDNKEKRSASNGH